ncbi:HD domain-containing protein [Stomatobaculum longum]|uniref:HD domain-containing protein n=1 Tax=Stomatobaculum longum TaxID=796942 RepID=UPI0028807B49|nr:HD domain-containing protein [Stomatobaculum longum]
MNERLGRQLAFALELDKEKNVLRQTHLTGHGRRENDAEHAWHMALMAYLLCEYANEPVDIARVMLMCLLHDVVEIDAGDTYAYDEAGKRSQEAREAAAAERIFGLLPEDQAGEFRALFAEFDAGESADARFARAMDNLQPLLLNDSNDGGDWKEHAVTAAQVYGRQRRTELGSAELFRVTDEILQRHIAAGHIRSEAEEGGSASGNA